MKVVIPGGSGALGTLLDRGLTAAGHQVVTLSRRPAGPRQVGWDGRTLGAWAAEIDGSDVVLNLAGRSVNCRYTEGNRREMMDSRVRSARVVGQAIATARRPPAVWLQMSTATVYAHRHDAPNGEPDGLIGGAEPDTPASWRYSVDIARAWEDAQTEADTPATRKVALRTAVVLGPERGGAFDSLSWLARLGVGGPIAGGAQYVSWIHERDFARAVDFLVAHEELTGPVNLAAPNPLPQRAFMRDLRTAWGMPLGLPATRWMAELGAFALRSETELLLKSRRVVPTRLLDAGFGFEHPRWPAAARDLVRRLRGR
ncbi:TIGR01777 family oxidoreductase [Kitasatospora sp. NPDC086791]|uniref:TIGR01777 family oxidoreductase n=1 Tax=Kitasatospora sp. NPDC086791 TaxID=3155178 RepID=UPI00343D1A97